MANSDTTQSNSSSRESFAALFEAQSQKRIQHEAYAPGQKVEGIVTRIGRNAVFVELDGKSEGFIEGLELQDANGNLLVKIGDPIRATIVDVSSDGGAIHLARTAPRGHGLEGLKQAFEVHLPVEGEVTGVNKGGLDVMIEGVRAFCPAKSIEARFVNDLSPYVGQRFQFLVTSVKGRDVIVSRRALLEREAEAARERIKDKLVVGAVLRGNIVAVRDHGATVDLGGFEGWLPASELSHDRTLKPADLVKLNDEVDVQIVQVDTTASKSKIVLSLKALSSDPWESLAPTLRENSMHQGRVVRVVDFGAFVQIAPGLDGLLHTSEWAQKTDASGQNIGLKAGDWISIRILKIDLEQRKISLGLASAGLTEGAESSSKSPASLKSGSIVTGTIIEVERFGAFVELEGFSARGFLPAQELLKKKTGDIHKLYPIGTEVRAKVVAIDSHGKIRLSMHALQQEEERTSFEEYREREHRAQTSSLGLLGQKLKQAGLLNKPTHSTASTSEKGTRKRIVSQS